MSNKSKISSLIIFAFVASFVFFFNITKHRPAFSPINPFAEDPYDAIGSFAFQAAILFGLIALLRAFRSYPIGGASDRQKLLLARTQIAAILCGSVTITGDLVAMIRHWSLWSDKPAGLLLLLFTLGFLCIAAAVTVFVYQATRETRTFTSGNPWIKPFWISLLFLLILFLYPEHIRESVPGALFTVLVGAILLFMTVWAWGGFLLPGETTPTVTPKWLWGIVILIGVLLGLSIVFRELTAEGGAVDLMGSLFVISIYVGLEVAAILIGYAFLGKFLGLFQAEGKS
jgi:hypothetical protein